MHPALRMVFRQPFVGITMTFLALCGMVVCWAREFPTIHLDLALLGVVLPLALAVSYRFPVHIQRSTKVCMGSVALFLIAVLLPPALAAAASFAGVLLGTWMGRHERGLLWCDIATDSGRLTLVSLLGSIVAHLSVYPYSRPEMAILAIPVLWIGDALTTPLIIGPITGESPWHIIKVVAREGGVTEAYQYLLGLLGAIAAMQEAWAALLLAVPIIPLHFAFRTTKETQDSTRQVLEAMADMVDLRDPYTGGHSVRVAQYAEQILAGMQLGGPEVDLIVASARVHDIGKIGTPDSVLLKEGRLTPEERACIEEHPGHGAQLLARYEDFARGTAIVRGHHERWDGMGYPDRLKGTEIPFGARVIAVADSFDAMTSDRPYRAGMPAAKAVSILLDGRGTQWDADIVNVFVSTLGYDPGVQAAPAAPATTTPAPESGLPGAHLTGAATGS